VLSFLWFCLFWLVLINDCCWIENSPLIRFLHAGAVELAAVGVSASGFNLVSKAFNVPLLNVTASFVAEEQALIRKEEESIPSDKNGMFFNYGIKVLVGMSTFAWHGHRFSFSDVYTNSFDLMWVMISLASTKARSSFLQYQLL